MSRFDYLDDEDSIAPQLWETIRRRVLHGKKGRAALQRVLDALLALPEHRLADDMIAGYEYREDLDQEMVPTVCAIAAVAAHEAVRSRGIPWEMALDSLAHRWDGGGDVQDTAKLGKRLGLGWVISWTVTEANDLWAEDYTPEARWAYVVNWIQGELAKPEGLNRGRH